MTREDFILIIKDLNDKFRTYKKSTGTDSIHYDILHMSILELKGAFSDDFWKNNLPNTVSNTVDRLEQLIYVYTSNEYKKDREKDIEKALNTPISGKIETPKDETRKVKIGVKRPIGFLWNEDEYKA